MCGCMGWDGWENTHKKKRLSNTHKKEKEPPSKPHTKKNKHTHTQPTQTKTGLCVCVCVCVVVCLSVCAVLSKTGGLELGQWGEKSACAHLLILRVNRPKLRSLLSPAFFLPSIHCAPSPCCLIQTQLNTQKTKPLKTKHNDAPQLANGIKQN